MDNTETLNTTGSNPILTMLLFGGMMAGLITAGSHVSKQRSLSRDIEKDLGAPITYVETAR